MRRGVWIVPASLLAAWPMGCGGSSHSSPAGTTASSGPTTSSLPSGSGGTNIGPATVVALSGHVLRASDLPGFTQRGPLSYNTKPGGWVRESEQGLPAPARRRHSAALQRLGFTAGVREQLEPAGGGPGEGISIAERFGSPGAARAELQGQIAQLNSQGGFSTFPVTRVPGARGLATTAGGHFTGLNIAFSKGPYYYLVGVGSPAGTAPAATRAQLIAAAQRLYERVPS